MPQEIDQGQETLYDDGWLEQQRNAIKADRQYTQEALNLFRRATETFPKLDTTLREYEEGTKKLQVRLESEAARILSSLDEVGTEHLRALAEKCQAFTNDAQRLMEELRLRQTRLESEGARILTSLGEAENEHRRALIEKCGSLTDEARRSMEEACLRLGAALHSLPQRLDSTETALSQDRTVINQLNRKLIEQSKLIEKLTRRLEELEKEQRDGLATVRGTTSQLHAQVSRLTGFLSWFASGGWWRRLFERPPVA